jgi:hypothetical protein
LGAELEYRVEGHRDLETGIKGYVRDFGAYE